MGQVDVSELLSDPDFVDPIQVISRASRVNSMGENSLVEATRATVGSVQPITGKTLQRLPEGLRNENLMSFWIRGPITAGGGDAYPILFTFRNTRFEVRHVFDWTNWGSGWSEGVCVARPMT